ncbi:hypothetical protein ABBQ32_005192 [Trebouxia sp. C0010 RCD-2024]
MAHALLRSARSLQRLAQASAASIVVASDISQPASFTSLLTWHRQSTTHKGTKWFSSDDKQDRPQTASQEQASARKEPAPGTSWEIDQFRLSPYLATVQTQLTFS